MSRAGANAVCTMLINRDVTYFHDFAKEAEKAMEQDAFSAIKLFTLR